MRLHSLLTAASRLLARRYYLLQPHPRRASPARADVCLYCTYHLARDIIRDRARAKRAGKWPGASPTVGQLFASARASGLYYMRRVSARARARREKERLPCRGLDSAAAAPPTPRDFGQHGSCHPQFPAAQVTLLSSYTALFSKPTPPRWILWVGTGLRWGAKWRCHWHPRHFFVFDFKNVYSFVGGYRFELIYIQVSFDL